MGISYKGSLVVSQPLRLLVVLSLVTFRVSRRPREMYCGHVRLCVCVSVCPRPHAYTIARTRM